MTTNTTTTTHPLAAREPPSDPSSGLLEKLHLVAERILAALVTLIGAQPALPAALTARSHAGRVQALTRYRHELERDTARRRAALERALAELESSHQAARATADKRARDRRMELDQALAEDARAELLPLVERWYYDEPTRALSHEIGAALVRLDARAAAEIGAPLSDGFLAELMTGPLAARAGAGVRGMLAPTRSAQALTIRYACSHLLGLARADHAPQGGAWSDAIADVERAIRAALPTCRGTDTETEIAYCEQRLATATDAAFARHAHAFERARYAPTAPGLGREKDPGTRAAFDRVLCDIAECELGMPRD